MRRTGIDPAREVKEACKDVLTSVDTFFACQSLPFDPLHNLGTEVAEVHKCTCLLVGSVAIRCAFTSFTGVPALGILSYQTCHSLYRTPFTQQPAQGIKELQWPRIVIAALPLR